MMKFNLLGLIPRSLLRLCHSREGRDFKVPDNFAFEGYTVNETR
jgi:hypothetical protein